MTNPRTAPMYGAASYGIPDAAKYQIIPSISVKRNTSAA